MPTIDAQGRTISDDGYYWWDGSAWQLIQRPTGENFLNTLADSVEGVVKKVEASQPAGAPIAQFGSSAPPATTPPAQAPAAAGVPVIPASDLNAYLGALKGAGVVTDAEYDRIGKRIQARA